MKKSLPLVLVGVRRSMSSVSVSGLAEKFQAVFFLLDEITGTS